MRNRRSNKKIVLGLILILLALSIVIQESSYQHLLPFLGNWSLAQLIVGAILLYWAVKSILKGVLDGGVFILTIFAIVFKANLNIGHISSWRILLVGLLLGLGLSLLFGRKEDRYIRFMTNGKEYSRADKVEKSRINSQSGQINIERIFSNLAEYVESMTLEEGEIQVIFSKVDLYLDQVDLAHGQAHLELEAAFSDLNLYVPKDWEVYRSNLSLVGTSLKEYGYDNSAKTKKLILEGGGAFSKLAIHYI